MIAGVLVYLALLSQVWASGGPTAYWALVYAATIAAVVMAALLGRTVGGWIAGRVGRDRAEGRQLGMAAFAFLGWLVLNTYDRLFGG